jgi:hypothetical protein
MTLWAKNAILRHCERSACPAKSRKGERSVGEAISWSARRIASGLTPLAMTRADSLFFHLTHNLLVLPLSSGMAANEDGKRKSG